MNCKIKYKILSGINIFIFIILLLRIPIPTTIFASDQVPADNKKEYVSRQIEKLISQSKAKFSSSQDSAFALCHKALKFANHSGPMDSRIDAFYNAGYLYYRAGKYDKAENFLNKSLNLSRDIADSTGIARALNRLGNVYWLTDKQFEAQKKYKTAYKIHKALNNTKETGRAINNLANVNREWGNYQKAIQQYLEAIDYYDKSEFMEGKAWLNFSLTILYKKLGDHGKALESINKSLSIYKQFARENQDSSGIMLCYGQLGDIYNIMNNPETGLKYHLQALRLRKKTGVKPAIADGMSGVGQTYYQLGKYEQALEYFKKSQEYRQAAASEEGMPTNLKYISYIYQRKGKTSRAIKKLNKGLEIARELNQQKSESDILKQLSNIYNDKGKFKKAWNLYQEHLDLKNSLMNNQIAKQVAATQINNKMEEQSRYNKRLEQENKIKELKLARSRIIFYLLILLVIFSISAVIFTIYLLRKKSHIKTLKGLIPICSNCKKIRTDKGYYQQLEEYISEHSEIKFSHGLCPECADKLYPDYISTKD